MKTLEDKRLYTRYERFKAGEIIFDYIFENCIPAYDELLINKYKDYSIYVYTIKDISIKILLDNESKILYDLSYKDVSEKRQFSAPNETIDFDDYKELIMYFFDKLLYSIYLSATDNNFKVKDLAGINRNFKMIMKDR